MRTGQGGVTRDATGTLALVVLPARWRSRNGGRPRSSARAPAGRQRGAVTAEVAVVLPALVVLLALLLGTAHVGLVQLRLEEAARAGAREAMRGESNASVEQTVQRLAGGEARSTVTSGAGWTTVEVRATIDGPVIEILGLELTSTASGRIEHGG